MAEEAFERARAEAMLVGYDTRWRDEPYKVLAVEVEYRAPLINPDTNVASRTWQRGGKIDAIVKETSSHERTLIVEHKTTSEDLDIGSTYWRRLIMDGQVSGYFLGAEALGFKAAACLYDVLRKPALRPFQVSARRSVPETPAEFRARCIESIAGDLDAHYRRGHVVRLDSETREALWDDWQWAQAMREAERTGRHPRNTDSCVKWSRTCDFFDVCCGEALLSDTTRFRRLEKPNPELKETIPGDRLDLPLLTTSRLSTARTCQRLHRFRYLDGYRPVVEAEPLIFGQLIHEALEAWWTAPVDRLAAALAAIRKETL